MRTCWPIKAVPKLYVEADAAAPMAKEWVTWKLGVKTLVISHLAPSNTWFVKNVSISHIKKKNKR